MSVKSFIAGHLESQDFWWIGWFVMLTMLAFAFNVIDPTKAPARVYSSMGYFSLVLIALALIGMKVFKQLPVNFVAVSGGSFWPPVFVGLGLAVLLTSGYLFNMKLLAPLDIPAVNSGVAGIGLIGLLWVYSVYVSELEETFRASTLVPSFSKMFFETGTSFTLILISFIVYFVLGIQLAGIVLFIAAMYIRFYNKALDIKISTPFTAVSMGVFVAAAVFAFIHYSVYGAVDSLLFGSFLYAVIADFINIFFGNTVASRIAHTSNNAVSSLYILHMALWPAGFIVASHIFILWLIRGGNNRRVYVSA